MGTGWVLDNQEGLIVTNAHVVEGTPQAPDGPPLPVINLEIRQNNGPAQRATVHAVAPCEDLALLRAGEVSTFRTWSWAHRARSRRARRR